MSRMNPRAASTYALKASLEFKLTPHYTSPPPRGESLRYCSYGTTRDWRHPQPCWQGGWHGKGEWCSRWSRATHQSRMTMDRSSETGWLTHGPTRLDLTCRPC